MMRTRPGFTLVELMIALLVGSMVIGLGYATLQAGIDTQERVTAARDTDADATVMRAMLVDALRHAVTGDATDPQGLHSDEAGTRLSFVTRGIESPLGGSARWAVSVGSDSTGVVMRAVSREDRRAPLVLTARGSRTVAIRFLPMTSAEWRSRWDDPSRLPEAVELRFLDAQGRDAAPPMVARTSPVSGA